MRKNGISGIYAEIKKVIGFQIWNIRRARILLVEIDLFHRELNVLYFSKATCLIYFERASKYLNDVQTIGDLLLKLGVRRISIVLRFQKNLLKYHAIKFVFHISF